MENRRIGGRKVENGYQKLKMETRSQKMETGTQKMETGIQKMEIGDWYPEPGSAMGGRRFAIWPASPGDHGAQYINIYIYIFAQNIANACQGKPIKKRN